jgi:hypothetical protein
MAWQSSKFSNTTSASYWFQALARIQREGKIILTKKLHMGAHYLQLAMEGRQGRIQLDE